MKEQNKSAWYVNKAVTKVMIMGLLLSIMTFQANAAVNETLVRGAKFIGNCFVIYDHPNAVDYVTEDDREILVSAVDHIISVATKYGVSESKIREVVPYAANNLHAKFGRVSSKMSSRKIKKLHEAVDLCKEIAVDLHKF